MKKILIATSALAAFAATSAFALDVKTSGAVEYKYTKDKADNKAQNPKLSRGGVNVKFAAEGASNGLAYGAWVNVKTNDAINGNADAKKATITNIAATGMGNKKSTVLGYTQGGLVVYQISDAGVSDTGGAVTEGTAAVTGKAVIPNNNATTQSAMWVSGSFGKLTIGQGGSAAGDLGISGSVKAASFGGGTQVASASADQKEAERVTYTAPTFVDGLSLAYTMGFKGNKSTTKSAGAKAASNWAVKYSTDMMGVSVSVAHASGTTSSSNAKKTFDNTSMQAANNDVAAHKVGAALAMEAGNNVTVSTDKARTNTQTGITLGYGNFTVGYGTFNNEKKWFQKKDTSGSNYGVKYASGDWAVGYTVQKSEDTNKYQGTYNKSASTSAYSASYTVASGFSVYASKSSNSVKKSDNTTAKKNFTIVGAKISF